MQQRVLDRYNLCGRLGNASAFGRLITEVGSADRATPEACSAGANDRPIHRKSLFLSLRCHRSTVNCQL
ncbi:hypothetical protein QT971_22750, partial [Microcoleus sp. herbarium19]